MLHVLIDQFIHFTLHFMAMLFEIYIYLASHITDI